MSKHTNEDRVDLACLFDLGEAKGHERDKRDCFPLRLYLRNFPLLFLASSFPSFILCWLAGISITGRKGRDIWFSSRS